MKETSVLDVEGGGLDGPNPVKAEPENAGVADVVLYSQGYVRLYPENVVIYLCLRSRLPSSSSSSR